MQPMDIPAFVSKCIFWDNQHFPGPDCPHDNVEDEQGDIQPPGWTAQGR